MRRTLLSLLAASLTLTACSGDDPQATGAAAPAPGVSAPDVADPAAATEAPAGDPNGPATEPAPSSTPTAASSRQPEPADSPVPIDASGTVEALGVRLVVPPTWSADPNQRHRWEGADGFAELDAAAGVATAMDACREQAEHRLQPYGSSPTIERALADGQDACVVIPSGDQPGPMAGQALAAVRYPAPVQHGEQTYAVAVLYAPADRVRDLLATLRFAG